MTTCAERPLGDVRHLRSTEHHQTRQLTASLCEALDEISGVALTQRRPESRYKVLTALLPRTDAHVPERPGAGIRLRLMRYAEAHVTVDTLLEVGHASGCNPR